jgi:hypothetical protein
MERIEMTDIPEQLSVAQHLLRVLGDQIARGKYRAAAEVAEELTDAVFDLKQSCVKAHARPAELEKKPKNPASPATRYL